MEILHAQERGGKGAVHAFFTDTSRAEVYSDAQNEAVMFEKWLAVTDETLKTARSEDSFKVMG